MPAHRENDDAGDGPGLFDPPPAASPGPRHGASSTRGAKRRRTAIACASCRYRKSRCDGGRPNCGTCRDHGYECVYPETGQLTKNAVAWSSNLESVEGRLASVERLLRGLSGRVGRLEDSEGVDAPVGGRSGAQGPDSSTACDEPFTEANPCDPTDGIGSIVFTQEENTGYFGLHNLPSLNKVRRLTETGPSSNIAFTRHVVRATTAALKKHQAAATPTSPNVIASHSRMLYVSRPPSPGRERRPGPGADGEANPIFFLPAEEETMQLVDTYFSNTGLLFPYIHRGTFIETYRQALATDIHKVRRSWLGLLNMILAMATNTSSDTFADARDRSAKSERFFSRALGLCEKQMRSGSSLEIVQFLLLMSQYLQGTERSTQTWNIHGLAVKAAYQLGLHSKDALSHYPPLERETRARTWYGCVILDRSLSMTLGRPSSIPEHYVRLDMPRSMSDITSPATHSPEGGSADSSLAFFNSTITLYRILGKVLDSLYGGNLGCDSDQTVFDIASHHLQIEQQLILWKQGLAPYMQLIQPSDMLPGLARQGETETLRFRVILTLRYLSVQVLAHRPILHKFLEALSEQDAQSSSIATLRQVGLGSLQTCIQSAIAIVELISQIVSSEGSQTYLGAWWFSLYYTFNAALVLYSGLLVQYHADYMGMPLFDIGVGIRRSQLQQSIDSLLLLDRGNRMTEKCAKYTSKLARMLDSLYCSQGAEGMGAVGGGHDMTTPVASNDKPADVLNFGEGNTPLGPIDASEFMDLADLDFLNNAFAAPGQLKEPSWSYFQGQ